MKRCFALLVVFVAAGSGPPTDTAWAARDVRASVVNATSGTIDVEVRDLDWAVSRTVTVAPGATGEGLSVEDPDLVLDLPACDALLYVHNPGLIGSPEASILADGPPGDFWSDPRAVTRSVAEGDDAMLSTDAVEVRVTRRDDSRAFQEFRFDIIRCSSSDVGTDDEWLWDGGDGNDYFQRPVRADIHNATDQRLAITAVGKYDKAPLRRLSLKPDELRRNVWVLKSYLNVALPCGIVGLDNPLWGRPTAAAESDLSRSPTWFDRKRAFQAGDEFTFEHPGFKVRVSRQEDWRDRKQFTVDVVRCVKRADR